MVQHKVVRWICSNWDREASVSNMEASLCMKKLENRQSIAQLKMMRDLITWEKQICKKSLPVRQRCTDVRFKPIYRSLKSHTTSFFPMSSGCGMNSQLPRETVNQVGTSKFLNDIESCF